MSGESRPPSGGFFWSEEYDRLTDSEWEQYRKLYRDWTKAREAGNWQQADALRAEYARWNRSLTDADWWHPHFEEIEHRRERIRARKEERD